VVAESRRRRRILKCVKKWGVEQPPEKKEAAKKNGRQVKGHRHVDYSAELGTDQSRRMGDLVELLLKEKGGDKGDGRRVKLRKSTVDGKDNRQSIYATDQRRPVEQNT